MPDILTRADKQYRQLLDEFQAQNEAKYPIKFLALLLEAGEINRSQYERLRREVAPASESPQNAEKDSDHGQEASEGSQRNLTQSRATPETIRISLPALRAVILAAIDDGYYLIYHADETLANNQRLCLADEIGHRLRQLPTVAEREK